MLSLLLAAILATPGTQYWGSEPIYVMGVRYYVFGTAITASPLGPSAPNVGSCGSFAGYVFSSAAESVQLAGAALPCWDGTNDILFNVAFTGEAGDLIQDGETVVFKFTYRTIGPGESGNAGTPNVLTLTYTHSGTGPDCALLSVNQPIDADDATWPYTYGDAIQGYLNVDASSTYSGDPLVGVAIFLIPFNKNCHKG